MMRRASTSWTVLYVALIKKSPGKVVARRLGCGSAA
jgi:hypothetical protein